MLVKWIECRVRSGNASHFSREQERWRGLRGLDGFVGQAGGWDLLEPDTACILGLWRGQAAYDAFMTGPHDRILEGSDQLETCRSVAVSLFETEPGPQDGPARLAKFLWNCGSVSARWCDDAPGAPRPGGLPGPNGGGDPVAVIRGEPAEGGGPRIALFLWRAVPAGEGYDRVVRCEPSWTVVPGAR